MDKNSKAQNIRFEKEAEALQKNLAKRKKQQKLRQQTEKSKDTKHGQD